MDPNYSFVFIGDQFSLVADLLPTSMTQQYLSPLVLSTVPPPTINSLDASQRARLVKSTRKLGKVLGATPHVLDPDLLLPVPPRGKRNDQFDPYRCSSAASSVSSFEDSAEYHETSVLVPTHPQLSQNTVTKRRSKPKQAHVARPLVLSRLRTVPSLPTMNTRVGKLASTSTMTIGAEIPIPLPPPVSIPSPPSPLFAAEDDGIPPIEPPQDAIRRKQMDKLTRTLGENIPPEFLLPKNQPRPSQHQRYPSEPSSSRSPRQDWRRDEVKLPIATASHGRAFVPPPVSLSSSHPVVKRKHCGKSASLDTPPSHVIHKSSETFSQAARSTFAADLLTSLKPVRRQDVTGNEPHLKGEWSIKDAEKRAMALRKLRN